MTHDQTQLGWRCRHGWHSMRQVKIEGNALSSDRRKRHTFTRIFQCYRCPHTEQQEIFDSHNYWADFRREVEDRRLEEIIRRAMR